MSCVRCEMLTLEVQGNNEFIIRWRHREPSTFGAPHCGTSKRGVYKVIQSVALPYRLLSHGGYDFHGLDQGTLVVV